MACCSGSLSTPGGQGCYWTAQRHLARAVGKRFRGCRAKRLYVDFRSEEPSRRSGQYTRTTAARRASKGTGRYLCRRMAKSNGVCRMGTPFLFLFLSTFISRGSSALASQKCSRTQAAHGPSNKTARSRLAFREMWGFIFSDDNV